MYVVGKLYYQKVSIWEIFLPILFGNIAPSPLPLYMSFLLKGLRVLGDDGVGEGWGGRLARR